MNGASSPKQVLPKHYRPYQRAAAGLHSPAVAGISPVKFGRQLVHQDETMFDSERPSEWMRVARPLTAEANSFVRSIRRNLEALGLARAKSQRDYDERDEEAAERSSRVNDKTGS